MRLNLVLASLLVAGAFAGCTAKLPDAGQIVDSLKPNFLHAGPALWNDPQDAPHAKWGWPTLSNPPTGLMPVAWQPIKSVALPAHIAGLTHVAQVGGNLKAGAGIAIFGSIAVVPDDAELAQFVDISDPTHPQVVGKIESSGRGAAIIAYPNGRLVTAISTSPGFDVIEFTDPAHPKMLAQVTPKQGGHKLGIVPGTPILYNAASNGGGLQGQAGPDRGTGVTEIYNLTDPSNPVLVQDFPNGYSCHHIFFWNDPAHNKYRAICAGIEYTQIWDTADPEHPKVIVSIPVHYGQANGPSTAASVEAFSHSAGLNAAGTVLYVGDENGGGGIPPGCVAGTEAPVVGNVGTPVGATWFYDIKDEKNPRVLGYFAPPRDATHNTVRSCTTHHGRLVPDPEGRDLLAMSYYQDGVILIDFTGIDASKGVLPTVVDEFSDGSDTWETWYAGGYLFTGDLARGMDVLSFR